MNLLDVGIICSIIGFFAVGSTRRPISQFYVSTGALAGLLAGALVYSHLAHLAAYSLGRTVILVALILAAGLLCYDAIKTLGRFLESRYRRQHRSGANAKLPVRQRLGSSLLAGLSGITVLWLVLGMFDKVQIPVVQRQLSGSSLVAFSERTAHLPRLFQQVATLVSPFTEPHPFIGEEPRFADTVATASTMEPLGDVSSFYKVNSWGCGATASGSSFMISRHAVVTAAHVVAGANRISVQNDSGQYMAQVILFDPAIDLAVLLTEAALPGTVLEFQDSAADRGTAGMVAGYPGGKELQQSAATVLQTLSAKGLDIYDEQVVVRSIYALEADISAGQSGAPLVDTSGRVLGLVFGHSTTQARTGYAVTAAQIRQPVGRAVAREQIVDNGACTM